MLQDSRAFPKVIETVMVSRENRLVEKLASYAEFQEARPLTHAGVGSLVTRLPLSDTSYSEKPLTDTPASNPSPVFFSNLWFTNLNMGGIFSLVCYWCLVRGE